MRRAFAWLGGLVGVAALARLLHRRRAAAEPHAPVEDPASELRETLARSRAGEAGETEPMPGLEPDPASPEERRARVHERAQDAIDSMRQPPADE